MVDQQDLTLGNFVKRRFRYYWSRYLLMSLVVVVSVAVIIIAFSLFFGIQWRGLIPIELMNRRYNISDTEAEVLAFWILISSLLLSIGSLGAVYNTSRTSVMYSKKDIAVLKLLGVSTKQIVVIFISEILFVSVLSWFIGLSIGLVIVNQFMHHYYVKGVGAMFFSPSNTAPLIVLVSFIIVLFISVIGSYNTANKTSESTKKDLIGILNRY